jgi:hypothetical protein
MSNKFIKSPVLFLLGVLYNHNCSYNTYTTKSSTTSAIYPMSWAHPPAFHKGDWTDKSLETTKLYLHADSIQHNVQLKLETNWDI